MKVKNQIEKLQNLGDVLQGRILSIYMNTEPNGKQQDAWKIHLKNGLKRLREYSEAEGGEVQMKEYRELQPQIEKLIEDSKTDLKRGLVLIAGASSGTLFFETLQVPVPNAFYWEDKPHLEELNQLLETYPSVGVVQVGGEEVTVMSSFLGEMEQKWEYEWDLEQENWREFQGMSHANRVASAANHKEHYNNRYEVNRMRWLKGLCPILEKHGKRYQWDEIILTGEQNLTSKVSQEINYDSTRILSKNLNGVPTHQVLQEVIL